MSAEKQREQLASRLGFILLSAGCAIGLGNVWRFPFITGKYGGAAFVLIYLIFLVILGLPIMVMEFSIGRAGRRNIAGSFKALEPKGSKWHLYGYLAILGNLILMMFYTTVAGWMLAYFYFTLKGDLAGLAPDQVGAFFGGFLAQPGALLFWMFLTVVLGFGICSIGLQKGVEKITKIMMSALVVILVILAIRSISLPGAGEGLSFYLKPDFGKLMESGLWEAVYAAMGQAFFTLSLGIGSMLIFGSYIGKERSLTGESVNILVLDTFVALVAGLIIFPAVFAFGQDPAEGPGLVFVILPNIFNSMVGGRLWGSLFFLFMSFAAMSTVVAVFENLMAFTMDEWNWTRKKAAVTNGIIVAVLSIPCALGFNIWGSIQPLGPGTAVIDLWDFIVSSNLLPIGSLIFVFFSAYKFAWGWDNFIEEANTGKGMRYPVWIKPYVRYVLPLIILFVFVQGYIDKFFS
ncbi:MAG TPA: sodium-dependent transporter [Sediminispirochaeta sp.]|nr:sodium-dependent transporter [Sediminispirochaeta sp.]